MSEGWQVGDLALCVIEASFGERQLGKVFRVCDVFFNDQEGAIALAFEGEDNGHPDFRKANFWGQNPTRFRKIKPDTEPCEEEFITLLELSKPAKVSSVLIALALAGAGEVQP